MEFLSAPRLTRRLATQRFALMRVASLAVAVTLTPPPSFVAIQQLWGFSIIPYQHMFHREQHARSILPHYRHLPAVDRESYPFSPNIMFACVQYMREHSDTRYTDAALPSVHWLFFLERTRAIPVLPGDCQSI